MLYHRAGNLYQRDSSHGAAARRTVATISCCNNPAKALRNVSSCSGEQLTIALCPETAAITANQRLNKSPEPASIRQVLAYVSLNSSHTLSSPPSFPFLSTASSIATISWNLANSSVSQLLRPTIVTWVCFKPSVCHILGIFKTFSFLFFILFYYFITTFLFYFIISLQLFYSFLLFFILL